MIRHLRKVLAGAALGFTLSACALPVQAPLQAHEAGEGDAVVSAAHASQLRQAAAGHITAVSQMLTLGSTPAEAAAELSTTTAGAVPAVTFGVNGDTVLIAVSNDAGCVEASVAASGRTVETSEPQPAAGSSGGRCR